MYCTYGKVDINKTPSCMEIKDISGTKFDPYFQLFRLHLYCEALRAIFIHTFSFLLGLFPILYYKNLFSATVSHHALRFRDDEPSPEQRGKDYSQLSFLNLYISVCMVR